MAEFDSLVDSLMQRKNAPEASYIQDQDAKTLKLEQIPGRGQGIFAARSLSVTDPICSLSYPTMMAIDSDLIHTTCYHCLVVTATHLPFPSYGHASIDLKTCNGCHFARFCSKNCQIKSWHAYHKYECKIFKKLKNNQLPAILRAVLRVVLLQGRDKLPADEWNRITSLVSHEEILAGRGRSNLTEMAEGIKHLAESSMSIETIQRLIFIMKSNATELPTPVQGGIGVMLEPLVAKFNHSCEPNLSIHRPQHTMTSGWMDSMQLSEDDRKTFAQVIPLRDIQEGEELFNIYVAPTSGVKARKAKLMEDYFFECTCPKCTSDAEAAANLANQQPGLSGQFEKWAQEVTRHIAQIGLKSGPFQKAATAMDKSARFLEYPVLYTSGEFPDIARTLVLEGLKGQAFDEALIDALRLYFLVNPQRFVGRHNPTNIYTISLTLDIFDALLEISTPPGITKDKSEKWLSNLSSRGLSRNSLIYWRQKICADMKKRVEGGAVKDLYSLVEKREEEMRKSTAQNTDVEGEDFKRVAEGEMRDALRLKEPRWQIVLQDSGS
ncbi:hypothetical protein LTR70_007364 [Exophiala xenobiotica]|uniref:Suppressor of anucleate metulae protein B n=1 Tax=Lithohypha guttulata TaxID=1690604 RepID=A0ABR0K5I3_9EURO|nr:hypothetical protein LTR24_006907 [Lithohypha guttulata]KAK5313996.1 hypothetical protein LTR70_007364 [Exophiala xenobiotica]